NQLFFKRFKVKNCVKLFLCSIYFTVFSTFVFAVQLSEANFDRVFKDSYKEWFANPTDWKTSEDNKNEKTLILDVFLNEQEIEFLPKLFPEITTLDIRVDPNNSFSQDENLFFGDLDWDEDNQSKFTSIRIEKILNTYSSIKTFKLIEKNDIQLWLNDLKLLKKLTHLTIETDTLTDEELHKLCDLKLEFFKLTYVSPNTNIRILNMMECHKQIAIKQSTKK
ncbi:MAG: hypothetical protein Q8K37_01975, partial [Alphaproteobacteria bacterium]|nr:hypothetical protein [Alphaproteobacteria bacterium]